MSRINDALKKARQVHAATPPTAAGPELRPLRNPSGPPRRAIFTRPVILLAAGLLAGIAGWIWFGLGGKGVEVRANSLPATVNSPSVPAVEVPAPPVVTVVAKAEPAPVEDAAPASSETPTPPAPVSLVATEPVIATDTSTTPLPPDAEAPAVVDASSPEPTFVLQGLFYRPGSPAAIINGKTVSIGGHVGDARVVDMDQHSVTVVTAVGRTNVLEMGGQ